MSMSYNHPRNIYFLSLLLCTISAPLMAQVSVSGPICIVPGLPYQYIVSSKQDTKSKMRVCVSGGTFSNGRQCTTQDSIVSVINVIWKDTSSHKLEITSSTGNVSLRLEATTPLKGGLLHENDKVQLADLASKNFLFRCSEATGGACKHRYEYQWQQSIDGLNWRDIVGATSKDLRVKESVQVNTYFRRTATELNSNTTSCSEAGLLVALFR
jgi:hypothetical protein